MTWTSAFGRACGWLLDHIVHGLALTRISPNILTFFGLVINIAAAFLFGHANSSNGDRMFFYAGMVIFGAGIFDMVDGRVARRNNQVTVFGSFFDSVIDRYSDVRGAGGVCHDHFADGELHACPRRGFDRPVQGGVHGAAGTDRADYPGRAVQPLGSDGPGVVGAGRALDHHGCAPDYLYLLKDQTFGADWVSVSLQDRFMVVGFVSFK